MCFKKENVIVLLFAAISMGCGVSKKGVALVHALWKNSRCFPPLKKKKEKENTSQHVIYGQRGKLD